MASASVPHPAFTPNTTIASDEVNANFASIVSFLNDSVIQVDGSKAFGTGVVPSVDSDPSSANQLTRKSYVDALMPAKGTYTGTTDASSQVTVSHTLGSSPSGALATINGNTTLFGGGHLTVTVVAATSTTVTFKFWNGGTAYPSAAVKFHWMAWL